MPYKNRQDYLDYLEQRRKRLPEEYREASRKYYNTHKDEILARRAAKRQRVERKAAVSPEGRLATRLRSVREDVRIGYERNLFTIAREGAANVRLLKEYEIEFEPLSADPRVGHVPLAERRRIARLLERRVARRSMRGATR